MQLQLGHGAADEASHRVQTSWHSIPLRPGTEIITVCPKKSCPILYSLYSNENCTTMVTIVRWIPRNLMYYFLLFFFFKLFAVNNQCYGSGSWTPQSDSAYYIWTYMNLDLVLRIYTRIRQPQIETKDQLFRIKVCTPRIRLGKPQKRYFC